MKTIKRRILSIELNFSWRWDLAIHTSQSHMLTSQLSPLSIQAYFFYNPIHVHWYIFYPSKISTIFCPWGIHISVPSFLEWSSHRCLFNLYPSSHCYITIPTFLITPYYTVILIPLILHFMIVITIMPIIHLSFDLTLCHSSYWI